MVAPTTVFRHYSPFPLSTPQSTLSTAPLYGSLICLSLRRGAQRTEWWFRTGQHLDVTFQHYHGRPMVAPTTVFHLCSPFSLATPQSTSLTAPLDGSLICLSLRRGAQRAEWWLRTGQHLDVTFQQYRGRPMVAPTTVFHCPKIQKREVSDFSFLLLTILNPLISIPFHHKFINFIKHYKFLQTP